MSDYCKQTEGNKRPTAPPSLRLISSVIIDVRGGPFEFEGRLEDLVHARIFFRSGEQVQLKQDIFPVKLQGNIVFS